MANKIVILGSGPGGYVAAIRAAQLGGEVIVIEKEEVGGTCLNVGCIPTKSLLASVEVLSTVYNASQFGINVKGISFDFPKMMARKNKIVESLRKGIEFLFKNRKISLIKGKGTILEPGVVEIAKKGNLKEKIIADKIIIATGSRPAKPSLFPFDGEKVITSEEILSLTEVPASLLIVGGGVIGVEFACLFQGLGSAVSIVEMLPQLLPGEDKEIKQVLEREFKKRKIDVYTGEKIKEITLRSKGVFSRLSSGKELISEKVLVAVGRFLNTENIGLENLGINIENEKIIVNKKMETNIPHIYAIGDVTGGMLLAHKASAEGIIAAENALGQNSTMDYRVIPTCIFTSPEIGRVGLTEQESLKNGYKIKVGRFPFQSSGKAQVLGKIEGLVKVIANDSNGEIIGIHIIGPQATELIAEGTLAMKMELTIEDIAHTIHSHPTLSETIMESAHAVYNSAINLP